MEVGLLPPLAAGKGTVFLASIYSMILRRKCILFTFCFEHPGALHVSAGCGRLQDSGRDMVDALVS